MSSDNRVHYMDNLRAFAMLLGIFFHAALAYSPMLANLWLTSDPQNSVVVDVLAFFSHTFRMPLFFIVAGFFAALLIQKRGIGATAKNRGLRIVLPFVIFLPFVIISIVLIMGWAIENVQQKNPLLGFIAMMAQNPDAPAPPLTTTHLWFLYQLTFFYAVVLICNKLGNKFNQLKVNWVGWSSARPLLIVALLPVLMIPALATQYTPFPAPEKFMPQLWVFGFFFLFFLLGYALNKAPEILDKLAPHALLLFIAGCAAYGAMFYMLPAQVSGQEAMMRMMQGPVFTSTQVLEAWLEGMSSVFLSVSIILFARRFLNKQSKSVRLISDASYWIYIIHFPVLMFIQFKLLDVNYSLITEFAISSLLTFAIGFITYLMFVRWTPIGWLLNGRKKAKAEPQTLATQQV
ncbi:acyltransferase family protein [Glaciecola sp. 1036]|uniref:acyltransferase family protein n=1 Tax=Alteromonadaceae TaxID=72275 RepID=UPI003CFCAC44